MTYAPQSIAALALYWTKNGGVNSGIVGDANHTGGYHLGKDRIFSSTGKGWLDYSVKLTRDKNGLTNGSAGLDLGRLNNSLGELYKFSEWLVARCQAKAAGTNDIREIIWWSVKNARVQRWSGPDRQVYWGPGNGDISHKWHTHISFYRDSETRDKVLLFSPYFATMPPTDTEGTAMSRFAVPKVPQEVFIPTGTWLYDNSTFASSNSNIKIDPGRWMPYVGLPGGQPACSYVNSSGVNSGTAYWFKPGDYKYRDTVLDDGVSQADVDAAITRERAACALKVVEAEKAAATKEKERIARAFGASESARIRSL